MRLARQIMFAQCQKQSDKLTGSLLADRLVAALIVAVASSGSTAWAAQTLIMFDELPSSTSGLKVTNDYHRLIWSKINYLDGINYGGNPSGYYNGVVSANQVAYLSGAAGTNCREAKRAFPFEQKDVPAWRSLVVDRRP